MPLGTVTSRHVPGDPEGAPCAFVGVAVFGGGGGDGGFGGAGAASGCLAVGVGGAVATCTVPRSGSEYRFASPAFRSASESHPCLVQMRTRGSSAGFAHRGEHGKTQTGPVPAIRAASVFASSRFTWSISWQVASKRRTRIFRPARSTSKASPSTGAHVAEANAGAGGGGPLPGAAGGSAGARPSAARQAKGGRAAQSVLTRTSASQPRDVQTHAYTSPVLVWPAGKIQTRCVARRSEAVSVAVVRLRSPRDWQSASRSRMRTVLPSSRWKSKPSPSTLRTRLMSAE